MNTEGIATCVGDDIDTDLMYPGRYLAVLDPAEQARYLFDALGPAIRERLKSGGVLAGGWNLGCGSSREHAVTALIGAGTRLVVGKSFSRIFFRNMINNGLAAIESPELAGAIRDDSHIWADLAAGRARVDGRPFEFAPLGPELLSIVAAGGLWAARNVAGAAA